MRVCVCVCANIGKKPTGKLVIKPSFLHFVAEVRFSAVGYRVCVPGEQTKLTEIYFFHILTVSGEGNARSLGGRVAKGELGCNSSPVDEVVAVLL